MRYAMCHSALMGLVPLYHMGVIRENWGGLQQGNMYSRENGSTTWFATPATRGYNYRALYFIEENVHNYNAIAPFSGS